LQLNKNPQPSSKILSDVKEEVKTQYRDKLAKETNNDNRITKCGLKEWRLDGGEILAEHIPPHDTSCLWRGSTP
jgi:hypothetical protein